MAEKYGSLVAFGELYSRLSAGPFISQCTLQSDLPFCLNEGLSLTRYNRDTFYAREAVVVYIDYPFAHNVVALQT